MRVLENVIRSIGIAALLGGLVLFCTAFRSQREPVDENTIKALFVYNFTKQIEWPDSRLKESKFRISVVGNQDVKAALVNIMKGRRVFDKEVEVVAVADVGDLKPSHIIYIGRGKGGQLPRALQVSGNGTLVVCEEKGMITKGTCINIVEKNSQLRFEINESAMKRQDLKVSVQLINLAL
jgi:hypothetical protein